MMRRPLTEWMHRAGRWAALAALIALLPAMGGAEETPTSSGPVALLDTPVLRAPLMSRPPTIDGKMDEKEWEDASALSGFWYDRFAAKFFFLAPHQTQLQVYAAYDKDNLYIAYSSPVYPQNSWFKAMGRFPDVTHHPQYGLIWDDHIEFELRPYHDNIKGFRMGLLKWFVNAIGTISDQYYSQAEGEGLRYTSKMKTASTVTGERWTLEMAIPLESLRYKGYDGVDGQGQTIVELPPPDGTAYRVWFTRSIGGNGAFFNAFDAHGWNTTKTKLILDSQAPSFQVNELGPILDDIIDVELTVKNHNVRSETVRVGFFVESAMGTIYSSYEDDECPDGLLELVPGEVRKLRLKKRFPGISLNGNALWFDVRSAGRPAKPLFLTRLIRFHSMDGGVYWINDEIEQSFREKRINVIETMRPPRREFEFRYTYSHYQNRLAGIVDLGIYGASDEAKSAQEALLTVMEAEGAEAVVAELTQPVKGDFVTFLTDLPKDLKPGKYRASLLLFDRNKRIVGESNPEPFTRVADGTYKWVKNQVGLNDVVWEPFTPIAVSDGGKAFETLNHRFTLDPSGLPAQIYIKPDVREVPLEFRGDVTKMTDAQLLAIGRGPQLRAPLRLEAIVGGKRVSAEVVAPAKLVRTWKSELEYQSKVRIGPVLADLTVQYDCDGAMHVKMDYAANGSLDGWELVGDFAGGYDLAGSAMNGGGMAGVDRTECTLYPGQGVVWDSGAMERAALFYSHFVPWLFVGSGDHGFTWIADSDEHWLIDEDGSTMTLERDAKNQVTWRAKFANHTQAANRKGTIEFLLLTHPSKPRPAGARRMAWFFQGDEWAGTYDTERWKNNEEDWTKALNPNATVRQEAGPWERAYILRWTIGAVAGYMNNSFTGDLTGESQQIAKSSTRNWIVQGEEKQVEVETWGAILDYSRAGEDLMVWGIGHIVAATGQDGWWWDENWPTYRTGNVASGEAHFRDPAKVKAKELPWQDHYVTMPMRRTFKRLARVYKQLGLPNRQYFWASSAATCYESFGWDTMLVESAGSDHSSFELDSVVVYPASQFRYNAHRYTGLMGRVVPRTGESFSEYSRPGDDPRLDRQYFGRALVNDIGVRSAGPHGHITQYDEAHRLIDRLIAFGLFDADERTEVLPYYRQENVVYCGDRKSPADAHKEVLNPHADSEARVYVTVFRRPLERDGKKGYKALIVLMNENDDPVRYPLTIAQPERLFGKGGANTLKLASATGDVTLPQGASPQLREALKRWSGSADVVLKDIEDGGHVKRVSTKPGEGETYGNVFVPPHDYRILYAEFLP